MTRLPQATPACLSLRKWQGPGSRCPPATPLGRCLWLHICEGWTWRGLMEGHNEGVPVRPGGALLTTLTLLTG